MQENKHTTRAHVYAHNSAKSSYLPHTPDTPDTQNGCWGCRGCGVFSSIGYYTHACVSGRYFDCLADHFFSRSYSFLVNRMKEPCWGPVTPLMSSGALKLRRYLSALQMR